MRFLILGAGAVGGYFGGRMLEAGCDVTFLVRPGRAEKLAKQGLAITSPAGDVHLDAPPTRQASELKETFDVILVSCKAYDLDDAIESIAPAVGPGTIIVPLLNGMGHLEKLDERFGVERVAGGSCFISARITGPSGVAHLSEAHRIALGHRRESQVQIVDAIAEELRRAKFETQRSDDILLTMWEKWSFLATLAGTTCLMRASIGDIIAAGGLEFIKEMAEECRRIAEENGFVPRAENWEWSMGHLTDPHSSMTASMLDDVESDGRTEADHILGDLLRRQSPSHPASLLKLAYMGVTASDRRKRRLMDDSRAKH